MKYVIPAAIAAALSSTPVIAADAPVTLAKCDAAIGSIAVVDGDTQGWTKYGLSSPRDLIAAMAVQSGCFTLQANGSGAPADFLVNAIAGDKEEVDKGIGLAQTALTEGLVRSGAAGRMMGGIPFGGQALGMLGGFGGKKKTVAAGLRVISPATGQTIVNGSGEQSKTQVSIGGLGGFGGNPYADAARANIIARGYGDYVGSGYATSKDGQMLASAFVVAFNAVVAQRAALVSVKPAAGAAGATAVSTAPGYTTAIDTKLYAQPSIGQTVRALRSGTVLKPTGVREGLFVEVSDAYGSKGWVSVEDLR
ncbi:SH3 domain-containing protein [Rhizorhabdus argentea]|uniref:SH3 domain-containing protein n=1 Tax=Rhizorhabdus argentea TaxID=1387174 RepID=UPI0030EB9D72